MKLNTIIIYLFLCSVTVSFAQIGRGTPTEKKYGVHDGNRVFSVFSNQGVIAQPGDYGPAGAWIYRTNKYVGDVSPLVGVSIPVKDYNLDGKADTLYSVVVTEVTGHGDGDYAPGNSRPWTFEPIPGFSSPLTRSDAAGIAMSNLPHTWPSFWPDQPSWIDENGHAEWNGYFGRGQMNANQESYFMMDDNYDEKLFMNYNFLPDSTDPTRKGQALRVSVRGLQWSDFLAQDVIFWLYEITNVGTTLYKQAVFGAIVGTYVGLPGNEYLDDASFFNIRDNITYTWDYDGYVNPSANPNWQGSKYEVGYVAYSFLESPGNKYDGIDNDGDSKDKSMLFSAADFQPNVVRAGQKLILIDQYTYKRSEFRMPSSAADVISLGKKFHLVPDTTVLVEGNLYLSGNLNSNAYDGYDNDLDGLIDENYQLHYRQYKKDRATNRVLLDTLNPVQYTNYMASLSSQSTMIDEGRDDNVDNDNDWSRDRNTGAYVFDEDGRLFDDSGLDGKRRTGDVGENDGLPSAGEANFDRLDVDESDQIGLTSFHYFVPSTDIDLSDENDMWRRIKPGNFDVPSSVQNNVASRGEDGDFIYGSGYFPLLPGKSERFSLAFSFGEDYNAVIKTKRIAQSIYNANYNFPSPPEMPTLTAAAGDGKVILYWDKKAEGSIDPSTRENDFEGYLLYKSTDPTFSDIMSITDKDGNPKRLKALRQFDLANGVKGIFLPSPDLLELRNGVPFHLGDDTGIQNSFIDEDVKNGVTYFYALCAYDRGLASSNIFPAENSHIISTDIYGNFTPAQNCAVVVPNAPVAGYVAPEDGEELTRISGASTGSVYYSVTDPTRVIDAEYEVTFIDSLQAGIPVAYGYNVREKISNTDIIKNNFHFERDNNSVFNGISLSFDNRYQTADSIKMDMKKSYWNYQSDKNLRFAVQMFNFTGYPAGMKETGNYAIVFSDTYNKFSTNKLLKLPLPSKRTNFEVLDITDRANPVRLPFAYVTMDTTLSKGDRIMLANSDTTTFTWTIEFAGDSARVPAGSDTLFITIMKPITSKDVFSFTTKAPRVDQEIIKSEMDRIKVVPNPYVVSNNYEHPLSAEIRGRGQREIQFIHVPAQSEISIFTGRGNFVRKLRHDGNINDGTVSWDLRTEEGLDTAFGIYFYIVEDFSTGAKKTGKIALIK